MKAMTRAARIRAKKGRPRMTTAAREPDGRISRSGTDHGAPDAVAIEARVRHRGLSKAQAKDQRAGTYIGYLAILGRADGLSQDQYEAAMQFKSLRDANLRAIAAPNAELDRHTVGNTFPEISDDYADWCKRTIARYSECRKAIQDAQNENRTVNLWAAIDYCIIRDEEMPHMLGALRVACNALARFFRC
ncbi:hypothetical protein ACLB6G_20405 [Zhengella sp. ZM62]|uniref:hypothetical protein n=1 Tax=Zhengella sedimenti TaxID=3390035 RepID=UPI0039764E0F